MTNGRIRVIRHPSSVIRHPSSVIRHSSFVIRHSSFVIRHPSFVIRHSPPMSESTIIAAPRDLQCIVVTPETTVVETTADFVALTLYDGECGISPRHSPMIGRLGFGELRINRGKEVQRYYVDGGFVQVADNVVSVLTNRAVPAQGVDAAAAGELLRVAQRNA